MSYALPTECYCVLWLRLERNIPVKGDAWTLKPTGSLETAIEGDVLLTTEGPGHAAEIIGFEGLLRDGDFTTPAYVRVLEANYSKCKVGTRLIPWDSPEIRGVIHMP